MDLIIEIITEVFGEIFFIIPRKVSAMIKQRIDSKVCKKLLSF